MNYIWNGVSIEDWQAGSFPYTGTRFLVDILHVLIKYREMNVGMDETFTKETRLSKYRDYNFYYVSFDIVVNEIDMTSQYATDQSRW